MIVDKVTYRQLYYLAFFDVDVPVAAVMEVFGNHVFDNLSGCLVSERPDCFLDVDLNTTLNDVYCRVVTHEPSPLLCPP